MRKALSQFALPIFCAVMLSALLPSGCRLDSEEREVIYQISTIDALMEGVYDGEVTFDELKKHGDFAIGTFNALDGEMIGLYGKFYQIKVDGKAYPAAGTMKTPFAVVTFFDADKTVKTATGDDFERLKTAVDDAMPTKNIFYAVKVEGTFKYMKVRSVPRQERPYRKLVEVVKDQAIYEYDDIEGTVVGFWCPDYAKGVNVPGYHFHFISKDGTVGGHVLDCTLGETIAGIDCTSGFFMALPDGGDFFETDLSGGKKTDLEKVEK
ncbi:MAG: acetolactate decarboxylase [Deltaproteobacteria bacterium]|uniref:Alpha-acetolactate decarboxylase n=1 Tax=Candidatus Zymogenus saltonus TaxID=2844893 RepID=A0A9D8PJ37_9DELT|nr:acetolactate decarboxylase [Candidatus Zymogenus saltonus]